MGQYKAKQLHDGVTGSEEKSRKPTGNQEIQARVKSWLDAHGVSLEMRVAGAFRKKLQTAGNWSSVDHGRNYLDKDPVTGEAKLRETDVVARITKRTFNDVVMSLWLVAECKSSTDDAWVLYRGDWISHPSPIRSFEDGWEIRKVEAFDLANLGGWTDTRLLNAAHKDYCYSAASTNSKDKNGGAKNFARDAILQVLSAVKGVAKDAHLDQNFLMASFFVPVVVTSAPLFTVTLLHDGEYRIDPTLRELLIGRFTADDMQPRAIWVVNETDIENFASEYMQAFEYLSYRT